MHNEVYTVVQLAKKLEVKESTIANALRDGRIKGFKQFNKWYITHEQLLVFLASNQEANQHSSKRPNVNPNKEK